ncbi:OmpA-OmpF porin, OOP family [Fontimonas thermophila]|uniref:OmpA-OmpF porin, OOP family n=1 Tax=Fontimonas thermophila TaxID=1076937 RepID=A0A1I2J785_9GAMM|nr:OmpA family protein [Fontimonas thermophila]SFF50394.1 OmpA-OmpF porin, OOP family [Fontimonas thermophila]
MKTKTTPSACIAGALVAAASVTAFAQTTSQLVAPAHLAALGTYTLADDQRGSNDLDYATGIHLLYGQMFENSRWGYEIGYFFDNFETDKTVSVDYYRHGLGLDATYAFGDRSAFTPYLIAGIGGAYNDALPDSQDDWSWFVNAGVGFVTKPVTRRGQIRIRGEGRYVYDDFGEGYAEPRLALGIEIPLFEEREIALPPMREETRVVQVPTGLLDTDGDGVIDEKDQCPDTPAGDRVDGNGCTLEKIIELKGVTFEFDKTRLRPDAQTILDWAVEILKKYPDMQVEIAGHTDSIGTETYNRRLSEARAQAVKDYFVEHGVPETQLSVKGYGESEPRASNDTAEGRERNRRVELRILN